MPFDCYLSYIIPHLFRTLVHSSDSALCIKISLLEELILLIKLPLDMLFLLQDLHNLVYRLNSIRIKSNEVKVSTLVIHPYFY